MLKTQIKELRDRRVKLVADARAILNKASAEKREPTGDENSQWEKIMGEVDALKGRIDQLERQASADADAEREDEEEEEVERDEGSGEGEEEEDRDDEEGEGERQLVTLPDGRRAYVVGSRRAGKTKPGASQRLVRMPWENEVAYRNRVRRSKPEYRAAVEAYLLGGKNALQGKHARAIQADSDIVGGYLVMPQEFVAKLIKFVDDLVFIRNKATKYTVASAQSLGAPSLDTDVSDSDWTSELATGNEDNSLAFGKRELTPHPLAKRLKVSRKLLRAASLSGTFSATSGPSGGAEGLVRDRLGYKFGVTEEKAFLSGSGSQKPLGLFTASSRGISTGRDVVTGATTDFTADGLIDAKYTLKSQYHAKAEWLFHRDGYRKIRKLKDGNGQYLWAPGLSNGDPDTLLELPVNLSEYAPNTFTTGQYVGLLGDFSFYWVVDAESIEIQRLEELYAESNQVGFIARLELDGMPVLEEAFVRLKTS